MLKNNSNQEHVNSSHTDPLDYWQRFPRSSLISKSFFSLLDFVTLVFASAVAFFCLVITIFYEYDVTSVSSAVTTGAILVATAGALI